MEADWSVEIGGDSPVIEASWSGFVDLRRLPKKIGELEEVRRFPTLGWALTELNSFGSAIWTSKCDVWSMIAVNIDPDEMGAAPSDMKAGRACYLDILLREKTFFSSFERQERWVRDLTRRLKSIELPKVRVDLVVRRAFAENRRGYGLTVYCSACGPDSEAARTSLEEALRSAIPLLSLGILN